MFFLAATLVGWTGGDFVYRKGGGEASSTDYEPAF